MRLFQNPASARRNLAFFTMALALHIALLMLPIKSWQTKPAGEPSNPSLNEPITVRLQAAPKAASTEAAGPEPEAPAPVTNQTQPFPEKRPAAEYTLAEIPPPSDSLMPDEQQAIEASADSPLSTQQLRQWVETADGLALPQQARGLGEAKSYQPPANWNRNAGAAFFASFDDRSHEVTLPAEVTVLDRWQAPDGSQQVVVQLPNGESMCGRAEPYNPMQPLVEHIMMFRSCGSTPTFSMPERFNKGR